MKLLIKCFTPAIIATTLLLGIVAGTSAQYAFAVSGGRSDVGSIKTATASGWYVLSSERRFARSSKCLISTLVRKVKDSTPFHNGRMTSQIERKLTLAKDLGKRKFKVGKKVKYGKYSISSKMIRHLSKTKALSRKEFSKAAKKVSTYLLFAKIKKGKIVKAYWMSEYSAEMLD